MNGICGNSIGRCPTLVIIGRCPMSNKHNPLAHRAMPHANDYRALPYNPPFKAESLLINSIGQRPMTKNHTKRKTVGQRPMTPYTQSNFLNLK